jgi:hypothetical protein
LVDPSHPSAFPAAKKESRSRSFARLLYAPTDLASVVRMIVHQTEAITESYAPTDLRSVERMIVRGRDRVFVASMLVRLCWRFIGPRVGAAERVQWRAQGVGILFSRLIVSGDREEVTAKSPSRLTWSQRRRCNVGLAAGSPLNEGERRGHRKDAKSAKNGQCHRSPIRERSYRPCVTDSIHLGLVTYHATVCLRPSSREIAGDQPSSWRILSVASEYQRSWPGRTRGPGSRARESLDRMP